MVDLLNLMVDLVQFNSDLSSSSNSNFVVEYFKRNMSNNLGQLRDLSSVIAQIENAKTGTNK